MHAQMKIGDSMLMMGGATPEWPPLPAGIYLYVEDTDQTYARADRRRSGACDGTDGRLLGRRDGRRP